MKDTIGGPANELMVSDASKAEALHALGYFYLRQGFPKQALALLIAAEAKGASGDAMNRALAQATLLCGFPKKTLAYLDMIEVSGVPAELRETVKLLRGRALLALGRVDEARALFGAASGFGNSRSQSLAVHQRRDLAPVRRNKLSAPEKRKAV